MLAFTLTACSAVPDFANPIAIYNTAFGSDKSDNSDRVASDDGQYPRLGAVPDRPRTASAEERRRVTQGLVADRENARYTDDLLRAGEARPAPAFVAVERRAAPPPRQAEVQVAAVQTAEPVPVAPERSRRFVRPRDPAAPVPVEPRRRRQPVAAAAAPAARERSTAPAPALASRAADEDDELRRRRLVPTPRAAGDDTVDSRRRITSGSAIPPAPRRSTAPRFPVPVPRSIIQRDDEVVEPKRVRRPTSASVTKPRTRQFAAAAPPPENLRQPLPRAETQQSLVVAQAAPRRPPSRQSIPSPPPPIAVVPGEDEFSKVYARMLAASASTITTAPANPAFKATTALPLPQETLGVSPVVRESYNAALARASAPPQQPVRPPETRIVPAPSQVAAIAAPTLRASAPAPARRNLAPQAFFGGPEPTFKIKFPNGSARITGRYLGVLRGIANRARDNPGVIRVVGHASSRTRDLPLAQHNLVNFSVSLDRAQAVANALMRLGISPARIIVEARSDRDPIFFETMPEGEAENRRVEIFLDF